MISSSPDKVDVVEDDEDDEEETDDDDDDDEDEDLADFDDFVDRFDVDEVLFDFKSRLVAVCSATASISSAIDD
jgi:hypothetical protein